MKLVSLFPGPVIGVGLPCTSFCGVETSRRYSTTGLYGIDADGAPCAWAFDHTLPDDADPVWIRLDGAVAP